MEFLGILGIIALIIAIIVAIFNFIIENWVVFAIIGFIVVMLFISIRVGAHCLEDQEERKFKKSAKDKVEQDKQRKIVREHSLFYKKLLEINHKYVFLSVEWKEVFECNWRIFKNFDKKKYIKDLLKTKPQIINELFENVKKNENTYKEYYKEFCACEEYTSEEQIKKIRHRKMSVKRFKELEKELQSSIIKERPTIYISIVIQVKCQGTEKRVVVSQNELENIQEEYKKEQLRLLQERLAREEEEKRKREYEKAKQFVVEHSEVVRRLKLMEEKYRFYNISKPIFYIECESYSQYNKFNIRKYVKEQLLKYPKQFDDFFEKADKNFTLYFQYKKEYDACKYYLFTEITIEMDGIDFRKIQEIEKALYESCLKSRPIWEKEIQYIIRYSSPTGRNQYQNEEYLDATDINELLKEIQLDEEKKKQQAIERQKEAKERAELKNLLKKQEELLKREEDLARKEHEFLLATKGHIYTRNETVPEQPIMEAQKDSADRLTLLRDSFERGEITFEEYQEEKKKLW